MSDGSTALLGTITQGSLSQGLTARLEPHYSVEKLRVGKFVVVEGESNQFFSLITDVKLESTNQQVLADPPRRSDGFMAEVLAGTMTYGTAEIQPMLMIAREGAEFGRPVPVKTVPAHFSPLREAEPADFSVVFGGEDPTHFNIGCPLDMDTPVCLDLERFVERSNGVFGKSGTGKTFLTRLLLFGIIQKGLAINLVLDMHNEYGWQSRTENKLQPFVQGLKQLFPGEVRVFSLDPESSRRRGVPVDHYVQIPITEIEVEDVILLADELRLHRTAAESAYLLATRFKKRWLPELLAKEPADLKPLAEEVGGNPESISALYRKLGQLARLPFVKPESEVTEDAVERVISFLDQGKHVVLEFGQQQQRMLAYMLVANIFTRRIHEMYVRKAEKYYATQKDEDRPRPLMITVEEAHNFLSESAARQTIFGEIAREMRKYFVTLLVVDQRPSSLDTEVLSQIGTRVTALLNDEADINAVFTGVSGAANLRGVLARLDSKQQALILGHAVPMPVVVRTREYGPELYREAVPGPEEDLQTLSEKLYGS